MATLLKDAGGLRPLAATSTTSTLRLSASDREEISRGVRARETFVVIAARIDRSTSTVSREVERNGGRRRYRATAASLAAVERSRRPKTPKLSARPELRDVVVAKLVLQWSPQQIAPTERVCRRVHERLNELPLELRRTLTWDQGTEMSGHQQFTLDSGIPVFFCDPLSPWQRPTNENTNGLLRGYFPKGEDLGHVTSADLQRAEFELNNRPRRILNWLSPTQRLSQLCALTP